MEEAESQPVGTIQRMLDVGVWRYGLLLAGEVCTTRRSSSGMIQMIRSLVVSVIALSADFSFMVVLKEGLHVHYLLASAAGFTLGVVVNYLISVGWVFADRKLTSKHAEFTIFVGICLAGLLLNLGIIASLVEFVGLDYRISKAVSTVVVFFWNFIARKRILY